jgi:hypothetical protein
MSLNSCPACTTCDFCSGQGYWKLHDQDIERDCYGCDGGGKSEKCDEHKEAEDDE